MIRGFTQVIQLQRAIRTGFVLIGLTLVSLCVAEESLITNPPFKPVARENDRPAPQNIATQGSLNQRFELASILNIGGSLSFSVHDKKTNKPMWIGIGDEIDGIRIESYDSEQSGIVVSQGGQRELLLLREMKNNSNTRSGIPAYNTITPVQSYPKPPPSLPTSSKLLEDMRKKRN